MATNTIRIHRVLRAEPEKVYRAFLDPEAMAKWLPPNGFTGKVHQMDAKVGGSHKMSFTNFSTGQSHSFGGTYGQVRRPEYAGRNAGGYNLEEGFVRDGIEYRAGRRARRHPGGDVLPRLAGITHSSGQTCRS
jgi:hypothetical protein